MFEIRYLNSSLFSSKSCGFQRYAKSSIQGGNTLGALTSD